MTGGTTPEGITRRQLMVYATATPTLAVTAHLADAVATPAALPTQHLLVIEVTADNRVVVRLPRAEVGQGITTAVAQVAAAPTSASDEPSTAPPAPDHLLP